MRITCPHCGQTFEPADDENSPLRNARMAKGLSIPGAADQIGMSHWALSRLERGFGNPKLSTLKAIASFYGSTIDQMFPDPFIEDDETVPEDELPAKEEGDTNSDGPWNPVS